MSLVIWQGFDHAWQREAHRLARIGSWIEQAEPSNEHRVSGSFCSSMHIGRFPPDTCHTHTMLHRLGSASSGQIDGSVSAVLRGHLGEPVELDGGLVSHTLPEGDLTATVVMRGFELDSGFSHGFQTRGFGLLLSNIHQASEGGTATLSFVPRFFIFPDRSPDPFTNPHHLLWRLMPLPQALGPRTPDEFAYTMTLHYSVLFDRLERVRFTPHDVTYGPVKSRYAGPRAGPNSVHQTLEGKPGGAYRSASVGIRGFKWQLPDWPRTKLDGRYLRKLQCMLDGLDYDPQSGRLAVSTKMAFNNFGGRQGRERVRKWIAFLRARRSKDRNRLRAIARSLRMSYAFAVQFELNATLLQFKDGPTYPVSHLYNVVRKNAVTTQAFHI